MHQAMQAMQPPLQLQPQPQNQRGAGQTYGAWAPTDAFARAPRRIEETPCHTPSNRAEVPAPAARGGERQVSVSFARGKEDAREQGEGG